MVAAEVRYRFRLIMMVRHPDVQLPLRTKRLAFTALHDKLLINQHRLADSRLTF